MAKKKQSYETKHWLLITVIIMLAATIAYGVFIGFPGSARYEERSNEAFLEEAGGKCLVKDNTNDSLNCVGLGTVEEFCLLDKTNVTDQKLYEKYCE